MGRNNIFLVLALAILVGVIQLITLWTDTAYYLTQLTMAAYYSMVIIGLCLVMGYAGQISIGHAGFFGIGGYISAAMTTHNFIDAQDGAVIQYLEKIGLMAAGTDLYGESILTFAPWVAFVIALLATVVIAFAIGVPVLKLKGHYLAMATLGFGTIIYRIVLASEIFGEADGISEVPAFQILPGLSISGSFGARVTNYYIAWGLLIIGLILLLNLINSRVGRALRAIHGSEEAAQAMGINVARFKLYTFVISAVYAAMAGIFLTHYNGGIGPSEAGIMKSVRYVALVAIGGMSSIWGTLTVGTALNFMSLRGLFGSYDDAFFGIVLIGIMLFAPNGFFRLPLFLKLQKGLFSQSKVAKVHKETES